MRVGEVVTRQPLSCRSYDLFERGSFWLEAALQCARAESEASRGPLDRGLTTWQALEQQRVDAHILVEHEPTAVDRHVRSIRHGLIIGIAHGLSLSGGVNPHAVGAILAAMGTVLPSPANDTGPVGDLNRDITSPTRADTRLA